MLCDTRCSSWLLRSKSLAKAAMGFVADAARTLVVFSQWTLVSVIVDLSLDGDIGWRKCAALYLTVSTFVVNAYGLLKSYAALGERGLRPEYRETIFGLFLEVINVMQAFGIAWATARLFSLDPYGSASAFHEQSFLSQLGNGIFEMSFVVAGVGWAATPPTTLSEKIVAWLAATIGGVLVMNLFLVGVVLGRRVDFA